MKPIELRLAGLQSYRDEQRIDFEKLCETGLFGIFGPTGSGKSSILDAMTLALYGKVERAAGGTQGILNQMENMLSVSLTFALHGAAGKRTFRVERRFKRTGDVTVGSTLTRFIELRPEGDIVLADKLGDVNRCVEEQIGLKMDDFTRAVVLPQGKFAEFLSLKGSERRQMLQRLFSLEKYGDELAARLARRVKETDVRLKTCLAEQQGLGDASAEAVREAETLLVAAVRHAEEARAARLEAERVHRELTELRERLQEQERLLARRGELEQEAPKRAADRTELQRAREAEALLPYVNEMKELEGRLQKAAAGHEAARDAAAAAAERAAQAIRAADDTLRRKEAEEPELMSRHARLQEAVRLYQDSVRLREEAEQWTAKRTEAAGRAGLAEAEAARAREMLRKAADRQAELREAMQAREKPPEERDRFQQAVSERQLLTVQYDRCREQEDSCGKLAARAEQAGQTWLELLQTLTGHVLAGQATALEGRRIESAWQRLHAQASDALEEAERELAAARERQWQQAAEEMAAKLASRLEDGQPCPVCGSTCHAHRAQMPSASEAVREGWTEWEEARDKRREAVRLAEQGKERCAGAVHQWSERMAELNSRLRPMLRLWEEGAASLPSAEAQMAAALEEGVPVPGEPDGPSGPGGQEADEADASWEAAILSLQERAAAWERGMEQSLNRITDSQWELQQTWSAFEAAEAARREGEAEWKRAGSEYARSAERWAARYEPAGWSLGEMEAIAERWREDEAFVNECRARLDKGAVYVEDMQQRLRQLEAESQQAEMQRVQAESELNGVNRLLSEYGQRLEPWAGGPPIERQAAEAEAQLHALREHAARTAKEAEAARQAQGEAERIAALTEQQRTDLGERADVARERLTVKLAASSFEAADEVMAARRGPERCLELEGELAAYDEELRDLQARLTRLEEQLGGRTVSAVEWQEAKEQWELAVERDEAALGSRARAERDAEHIRSKHERWMVLEGERVRAEEQLGRLQQLQSIFRGNAFVEFIAEEQLMQVSRAASERLKSLTKQRYALEVDSGGGFVIRDDGNGGIRRPVSTLSGGETFLTSLALALALSAQIQLRGMYPLEFFFLDEGFGTLDPELLDTVVTALEKLHHDRLAVGVISHVPELRARLARKLTVLPAELTGSGSRIQMEEAD
ncbi:AAA family ATPase [Paenibacillus thiaminolyticus]|uniref:Nuclease SbcCD subunit C n=1 Tax=Paenibacillus thiaminolyticus TaxID=49283 RepID=A0A3A3GMN0_PANTH|nr:SMC family ATPase [Paenibacillus thiaminolyticus]RJG26137.1 SMC family ATPase [Paenibacillus thiaminolyticus]